jgi:hypothetical protein
MVVIRCAAAPEVVSRDAIHRMAVEPFDRQPYRQHGRLDQRSLNASFPDACEERYDFF